MSIAAAIPETEAGFQDAVIQAARLFGWRVAHFRPARTERGWRTPVAADGAGFVDLVLCRPPRILMAELKAERGRVRPAQAAWLAQLRECPAVEVYVWRPSQWDEVVAVLQRDDVARPPPAATTLDHV